MGELDEIDKVRLGEVLQRIQDLKIRFPNAEIKKVTGFDSGNISNFLKGKIPISDNFYKIFMAKFPNKGKRLPLNEAMDGMVSFSKDEKNEHPDNDNTLTLNKRNMQRILDDNHTMIETQRIAIENEKRALDLANRLAENNNMMFKQIQATENSAKETQLTDAAMLHGLQELLIEVAAGKRYPTTREVRARLGKLFSDGVATEKVTGTQNG